MQTGSTAMVQIRSILQDRVEPYRYLDSELVAILNTCLTEVKRLRPDAFAGTFTTSTTPQFYEDGQILPPAGYLPLSDPWPIDEMFFSPVVVYVAGYAELRDDEFTVDSRAALLLQRFAGQLLSNKL